ncbi:glycosyltransferase family 4 protein [Flammeovirga agarivorans]|uniref:Glycosyltransferase family 4 protein n=1 Tax=Flammeovirga agarivorans TaxID=2726742 RepID=A0A7X8XWR0_9BACT|nr:glycosyltransferase family 4 protein [Flammeovirga agarivorans]NLR92506.1 glycosyltransferase family 4 protein [Flammeovirga agarivorans]
MNILLSITNLHLGGAQMYALRLAESLSKELGTKVYVYDHNPEAVNKGLLDTYKDRVSINTFSYNPVVLFFIWKINAIILKFGFKFRFRDFINEFYFKRFIKINNINIINSHMYASDKIVSFCKLKTDLNFKFIITMHGEYELNKNEKKEKINLEKEYRTIINSSDGIIYTADKNYNAIKNYLLNDQLIEKHYIAIPDLLDYKLTKRDVLFQELGISQDTFILGMVSRGIPEKGWELLLQSYELLKKEIDREICLILIGDGEYLSKLVKEYSHLEGIHLLQFESNPLDYLYYVQIFDLAFLLSYFQGESVPNVIIEYLYFNKPIIASDIGEIPKMICDEANNQAGDIIKNSTDGKVNIKEVANVVNKYMNDLNYYNYKKRITGEAFKKFKIKECTDKYISFYKKA